MVQIQGTGFSKIDKSDTKVAGIKTFLQRKVDEQLNKMTKEGKTPFGTDIGGSAVGEEGLGRFGNKNEDLSSSNYFSPGGGASKETKIASADLSGIDFATNFAKGVNTDSSEEKKNFFDGAKLADNTYKSTFESDVKPDYTDTYKETLNILKDKPDYKSTYDQAQSVADDLTGGLYNIKESPYEGLMNVSSSFFDNITKDKLNISNFANEKGEVSSPSGIFDKKNITTKNIVADDPGIGYREGDYLSITPYKTSLMGGKATGLGITINPLKGFDVSNKTGLGIGDTGFSGYIQEKAFGDGSMYSSDPVTQAYKNSMIFNRKELANSAILNQLMREQYPDRYKEDGSLKNLDEQYGSKLKAIEKAETEFANKAGYETIDDYNKYRESIGNTEIASMPSMTISEAGREQAELNKTPKVEVKQPSVFDKTMNFIGNVTNKVLGIQDAGASQIGPVNVKTKETTAPVGGYNISPEGKVKALQNRIEAGIKSTGIPNNVAVQAGAMSPEARDQALQNRINAGIASTGIPNNVAVQGGVTTQAARDAGVIARQQRDAAIKMRNDKVQGIVNRNPRLTRAADGSVKAVQKTRAEAGVSARTAQGNRARVRANAKARAQAMAANRIRKGQSVSQAKAANKASMKAKAKARHAAFKKRRKNKKKK